MYAAMRVSIQNMQVGWGLRLRQSLNASVRATDRLQLEAAGAVTALDSAAAAKQAYRHLTRDLTHHFTSLHLSLAPQRGKANFTWIVNTGLRYGSK
jgi:hypothetical protein